MNILLKTLLLSSLLFPAGAVTMSAQEQPEPPDMTELAEKFPQYGWEHNMGYPTREHIEAIRRFGFTPEHRRSFHPKELEPTLFDIL